MKATRLFLALLLSLAFDSYAGSPFDPPSLVVTTTADIVNNTDHQTSLREALAYATTLGGAQAITFAPSLTANGPATILLGQAGDNTYGPSALLVTTAVTIQGPVQSNGITIARDTSAAGRLRLFFVDSAGSLTLNSVTLSDGLALGGSSSGGGGGLGAGGAIVNRGTMNVVNCLLVNNVAQGGSSFAPFSSSYGTAGGGMGGDSSGDNGGGPNGGAGFTSPGGFGGGGGSAGGGGFGGGGGGNNVSSAFDAGNGGFGGGGGGSDFSNKSPGTGGFGAGNGAFLNLITDRGGGGGGGFGGAIFNDSGTVNFTNSTATNNTAAGGGGANNGQGLGGAIFTRNGTVTITQSTLSANTAPNGGRGIYAAYDGAYPTVTINNSILGQSSAAISDFAVRYTQSFSGANNLIRNATNVTGTSSNADPLLGALASNGGPTQTLALLGGSPAFETGDDDVATGAGLTTDQRGTGFPRVYGTHVDIGAFEGNQPPVLTLPSSPVIAEATSSSGAVVTFNVTASDPEDGALTPNIAPASGSTFAIGDTTVNVSATDSRNVTTSQSFIVRVQDTTAPMIAAPTGGFPRFAFVGTLPNFTDLPVTSDNVGVTGVTQDPMEGSATTLGDVLVTLTAHDDAGNSADTTFTVTIRPTSAVSAKVLAVGEAAPGQGTNGLPADALLTNFGTPATDDGANLAFLAKWTSATGGKGSGLFLNDACLGVVGGDAPIAGAKYKSFTDPVVDGGKVVCIAALTGTPKPPATVVLGNLASQTALEVIAQAGGAATTDGAKFKAFKAAAVSGDYVGVFAQLAIGTGTAPKTTAANDLGLWIKDGSGPLTLALREGQEVAGGRIIKTLVSFVPGAGSPGQGRGWLSSRPAVGGKVMALAIFTDKTQGVLAVDAGDLANPILLSIANMIGDGAPNLSGTTFASYGLPALADDGTSAFLGTLTGASVGVTKANARGVFIESALESNYNIVVRTGDAAVSGAKFAAFKDPVLSNDGVIAFSATLKGGTVKGLGTTTLWWQRPGDALTLLAQGGADTVGDLPDAQWKAFTSLAIAGGGRGPIFTATLVPGKGGVTAKSAAGVWATDFTDAPRLLFRTGDTIDVNGTMKTLQSFTLLKATVGSAGVTRSFNDTAQVVWLATFTDKTTAIITTEVP